MSILVVVDGLGGIGKSAITIRFTRGVYIPDYDITIEDVYTRLPSMEPIGDDDNVQLAVFDRAGSDNPESRVAYWDHQAKGLLLVYAIDDLVSFEEAKAVHRRVVQKAGTTNIPVVLCGNKCDLEERRTISRVQGEEFAKRLNAEYFETSALANVNIENAFRALIRAMRKCGTIPTSESPKQCLLL
jgi:small GTP-binding protein